MKVGGLLRPLSPADLNLRSSGQNGSPTTIIGPPTSGARVLNEFWRDALGGEWVCTVAGTPGTWMQIRPAAVTADPSSGTIPTGLPDLERHHGAMKRHAGGYVWEIAGGVGTSAKVGFHGATPTAQRAGSPKPGVTYASQTISDPPTRAQVQGVNDGLVASVTLPNEIPRCCWSRSSSQAGCSWKPRSCAHCPRARVELAESAVGFACSSWHRAYKYSHNPEWRLMLRSAKCGERTRTELLCADFSRRSANPATPNRHDFGRTGSFLNHHEGNNTTSPTLPAG